MSHDACVYHRQDDSHVVADRLADGSVALFDSNHGAVHSLNPSAAVVWECCAEPVTVAQIVQLLRDDGRAHGDETVVIDALRQLERARLVVRRAEPSPLLSPSRRDALKRIARGSAAAAALPFVLTLTAAEQRLHAQGPGSTGPDVNGDWSGTAGIDPFTWTATQSGNSVTGPFMIDLGDGESVSGTMDGTISLTSLELTLTVLPGGIPSDPHCRITGTLTAVVVTNTSITATLTLTSSKVCGEHIGSPAILTLTKIRPPV